MDGDDPMEGHRVSARRCSAKSKQSRERCKRAPIPGGSVCKIHGGAAPQVQASAQERIAALVDPAIGALGDLVKQKRSPHARLGASREILDRSLGKSPQEISLVPSTGYLRFMPAERVQQIAAWVAEARAAETAAKEAA